jgi:hypothetical protein
MKGSTAKRLGPLLLCSIDWSDVADTYVRTYKVEGDKLSEKFITFAVRTYARSNDWSAVADCVPIEDGSSNTQYALVSPERITE